jgi:hypothetical protein
MPLGAADARGQFGLREIKRLASTPHPGAE